MTQLMFAVCIVLGVPVNADLGTWQIKPFGFAYQTRFSTGSALELRSEYGVFRLDLKRDEWSHSSPEPVSLNVLREQGEVCFLRNIPGSVSCTVGGRDLTVEADLPDDKTAELTVRSQGVEHVARIPRTYFGLSWVTVRSVGPKELWVDAADIGGDAIMDVAAGVLDLETKKFRWFSKPEVPEVPALRSFLRRGDELIVAHCHESDYGSGEGSFGALQLERGRVRVLTTQNSGLASNCTWDVVEWDGATWFAGRGGIARLNKDGKWTTWFLGKGRMRVRGTAYRAGSSSPESLGKLKAGREVPLSGLSNGAEPAESPYHSAFMIEVGTTTAVVDPRAIEIIFKKRNGAN